MGGGCGRCGSWKRDKSAERIINPISVDKSVTGDHFPMAIPPEGGRSCIKPLSINTFVGLSTPSAEAPNAVISNKPQSHWEAQTISMAIHRHSVLTDLTEDARDVIISRMRHFRLDAREVVFEQGWKGDHFFVVGSGELEVLNRGQRIAVLKSGDSFGELALLHDVPRTATVRTVEKSDLWGLDRKTFKDAVQQVNVRNYTENRSFLDTVKLFAVLTSVQKDNLLTTLTSQRYLPGKHIVTEGEPGDIFYILKEGTVSCSMNGVEVRRMHKGEYFGEQALLYGSVRTATVTAIDTVRVLSIGREQLTEVLGRSLESVLCRNTLRIALDRSASLSKLTLEQKEKVIDNMVTSKFEAGASILPAGADLAKVVVVIIKGNLSAGDTLCAIGGILADSEITAGAECILTHPLVATEPSDVSQITKEDLEKLLGGELRQIITKNENMALLKSVSIFRGLPSEKLSELLSVLQLESYENKAVIVRQNDPGDALFIVNSGQVQVVKDSIVLRTIGKNGFFGERSVLTNEVRTASVYAHGDVKCLVLHRQEFMTIIDESVMNLLAHRLELQDETVTLSNLVPIKCIGKGMFGGVYRVVHRSKGTMYALKTVSRRKIRAYDLYRNLQLEREILLELDHVFIVKLVKTFKDDQRVYFLQELVDGIDLFDAIRKIGIVKEEHTKFYTACLLLALEHLHERSIVYRDLKPENVMVDMTGYLKLVDFGTAKVLEGRTFTTIGTPHYMAPEVILGKGYGLSVDVWSLGIIAYEFLCGGVPFGEDIDDPYRVYEKILRDALRWPSCVPRHSRVREFIELLLSKNEALRNSGISNLKKHKWLEGFEWEKLVLKLLPAPYRPDTADAKMEVKAALARNSRLSEFIDDSNEESLPNDGSERVGWDKDF